MDNGHLLARIDERQVAIENRIDQIYDGILKIQDTISTNREKIGALQAQMKWLWAIAVIIISSEVTITVAIIKGLL